MEKKRLKVKWTGAAIEDISRAERFIARRNPLVAPFVIRAIFSKAASLADYPSRGSAVWVRHYLLRRTLVKNHYVFYDVVDDTVWIRAVVYGRKDYQKVLNRRAIEGWDDV
jgi:plasmid stabilization system protein ParE